MKKQDEGTMADSIRATAAHLDAAIETFRNTFITLTSYGRPDLGAKLERAAKHLQAAQRSIGDAADEVRDIEEEFVQLAAVGVMGGDHGEA